MYENCCTEFCRNIPARLWEWLAEKLRHSAVLGWVAEHFEDDSRNSTGMCLHNSVHCTSKIEVIMSAGQEFVLWSLRNLLPFLSLFFMSWPFSPQFDIRYFPKRKPSPLLRQTQVVYTRETNTALLRYCETHIVSDLLFGQFQHAMMKSNMPSIILNW